MLTKDIKTLITVSIKEYISSLESDIVIIDKNYSDGYIPFEQTTYTNHHVFTLVETGIEESTLSILRTLTTEVKIYKTFLDDDFVDNLAYIFSIYDYPHLWDKIIHLVSKARYELTLFSLSGIRESDYNRDVLVIQEDANKVAKYSEVTGSLSIPSKKSTIVTSLSTQLDMLFVYLNKNEAKDIIKDILTTFFERDRMPSYSIAIRPDGIKRNNKKNDPIIIECIPAPNKK